LKVERRSDGDLPEVRVLIDGRDLIELAREVEAHWAAADGQPGIAGEYSGLWPAAWRDLPEHDGKGRSAVLACACGEVGCWPLCLRIGISDTTVTWSDFSQPFRPAWRYDGLGPFTFERSAYERAVKSVTEAQPADPDV
jgi:hypothetical protein